MSAVMGMGKESVSMTSLVSFALNLHVPSYSPKYPVPSGLNLVSPRNFSRSPPGPVASTPFTRRLSVTQMGSVRNLKRSDSLTLQEKTIREPKLLLKRAGFS